jgi:hypothetical protein
MTLIKQDWEPLFREFIKYIRINSKEVPAVDALGAPLDLWPGQEIALQTIVKGMERGIHTFMFGKSRQVGISTLFETLDIFWNAIHPGMMSAYVIDKEKNLPAIRDKIKRYFNSFPSGFFGRAFKIENDNKEFMLFSNGSRLDFLTAGTGKKETHWGEGKGYANAHLTEVSKYGNVAGLESFRATLSESNPHRLIVYESQSNGFNHWRDMWEEFGRDEFRKRRNFIGFWGNPFNMLKRTDPAWKVFGVAPPDEVEQELIDKVKNDYGFTIKQEQLAWWRQEHNSSTSLPSLYQTFPFTIEQSFVATGYSFFQMGKLQEEQERCSHIPFKGYKYIMGNDFWSVICEHIYDKNRAGEVVLRIWEEPDDDATYVIGCDPAHGRDERNDRHAICVCRCFGDKIVQVAEYADNETGTRQAAWVLAHLAGAYKNCVVNVESAPGPGGVIMNELENLRERMRIDERFDNAEHKIESWDDFLSNARWYLYKKPDHFAPGFVKGWESNWKTKVQIMEQLRDKYATECIIIKSKHLIEEMMDVVRDGDSIGAPESAKDDRVIALALCNRAWIDSLMMPLLAQGETYEKYLKANNGEPMDKKAKFMQNMVDTFWMTQQQKAEMPRIDPHKQWLQDRGFE